MATLALQFHIFLMNGLSQNLHSHLPEIPFSYLTSSSHGEKTIAKPILLRSITVPTVAKPEIGQSASTTPSSLFNLPNLSLKQLSHPPVSFFSSPIPPLYQGHNYCKSLLTSQPMSNLVPQQSVSHPKIWSYL